MICQMDYVERHKTIGFITGVNIVYVFLKYFLITADLFNS
jgi:hypothetical protein